MNFIGREKVLNFTKSRGKSGQGEVSKSRVEENRR